MKNWIEKNNQLSKTFVFRNFLDAIEWMAQVAPEIEKQNHHPNWSNVYNRITINLSTHDAGNVVTEKDHHLAQTLDTSYSAFVKNV